MRYYMARTNNQSVTFEPDGTVKSFRLAVEEWVAVFSCALDSSLHIEYKRSDRYTQMLDRATEDFETRAKQQAESRLRESRSDSPDFSDEL